MYKDQICRSGSVLQLEDDMLTQRGGVVILPSLKYGKGTSFEGNECFSGPISIRKINGKYHLIYSSVNTHQLCYAVSDNSMEGFTFGGVIISNGDVDTVDEKKKTDVSR